MEKLRTYLRITRLSKGVTLQQVSAALNVSSEQMNAWEQSPFRMPTNRLAQLGEIYGVSATEFRARVLQAIEGAGVLRSIKNES